MKRRRGKVFRFVRLRLAGLVVLRRLSVSPYTSREDRKFRRAGAIRISTELERLGGLGRRSNEWRMKQWRVTDEAVVSGEWLKKAEAAVFFTATGSAPRAKPYCGVEVPTRRQILFHALVRFADGVGGRNRLRRTVWQSCPRSGDTPCSSRGHNDSGSCSPSLNC